MSTPTIPASAHIIDWESVAALCRAEWDALVALGKKLITPVVQDYVCSECGTEWDDSWTCECKNRCPKCNAEFVLCDKTADWLGVVAKALQWDDWEKPELAKPIAKAVEALCGAFNRKTQLTLSLCVNESNCGEEGDDLNPGDGYLDIGGWLTLSPAAEQFKKDYPAARVNLESWTVYNG